MILRIHITLFILLWINRVFAVPTTRLNIESDVRRSSKQINKELTKIETAIEKPHYQYLLFTGIDNDNYFQIDKKKFFHRGGDDFGQTHSFSLGGVVREPTKAREYGINFETSLYTRYTNCQQSSEDNNVVDQYFREITTLDFTFLDPQSRTSYFRYLFGVGLINEKKAIAPLALWQQSGNSGKGGFHRMIGLRYRFNDIPNGGRQGFVSGGWSIGKYISLEQYLDLPKHLSWMNFTLESGVLLRSVIEANTLYALAKWSIPLLRSDYIVQDKGFIDFNIQGKSNYYIYDNAVGFTTTLGIQFNFSHAGLILSSSRSYANQNPSFYRYTDNDSLINIMAFAYF